MRKTKSRMRSKKAQVQMMETIAVLLIFFILIVLGIMFYARVLQGNLAIEKEETLQLNAIKIAQLASVLPELQCSEDNIVSSANCIDLLKLDAASGVITRPENEIYYYDRLQFTRITIEELYPGSNSWELYDRSLADFSAKIVTNVPIQLLDPVSDDKSFGVMKIEYFVPAES